jgi:hypothetical protein
MCDTCVCVTAIGSRQAAATGRAAGQQEPHTDHHHLLLLLQQGTLRYSQRKHQHTSLLPGQQQPDDDRHISTRRSDYPSYFNTAAMSSPEQPKDLSAPWLLLRQGQPACVLLKQTGTCFQCHASAAAAATAAACGLKVTCPAVSRTELLPNLRRWQQDHSNSQATQKLPQLLQRISLLLLMTYVPSGS